MKRSRDTHKDDGQNRRHGVAMILAIIILILTSAISLTMVRTTTLRQKRFENRQQQIQAELIADSALEKAVLNLLNDSKYSGEVWEIQADSETARVTIEIQKKSEDEYALKVVTVYPVQTAERVQRTIETTIKRSIAERTRGES